MSEKPLLERFDKAFEDQNFTELEMRGFQTVPKLAFIAGAAAGWNMALECLMEKMPHIFKPQCD